MDAFLIFWFTIYYYTQASGTFENTNVPDSCVVNIATQLSFRFIVQLCVLYVSIFVSICFEWLPPWPDLPYKGEKYTYIYFFFSNSGVLSTGCWSQW